MIHEILDQQTAQVENDIIVLDSENAFNNQNRDVIFKEIKSFFPELLPYVLSTYNQPSFLFLKGDNGRVHTMLSTMGAHQGAPLGSMLYSAGQQDLLRQTQLHIQAQRGRVRALIDDITLQGSPDILENAIAHLIEQAPAFGIKFKREKIRIYIGECSQEEETRRISMYQRLFNNAIPIQNFSLPTDAPVSRGIEILNVPIGSEEFIMRKLNLKLKEIEKDIEIISKLQKVQEQ
jgi:hypothetical protein